MENWTYQFDRIDPELEADDSTFGRYTFNRYLYYEPNSYESWRKNSLNSLTYSAELIYADEIPASGATLSGILSGFYFHRVKEITNMNEEDHPNATSYGIITLEYENMPADDQGGGGGASASSRATADAKYDEQGKAVKVKPWEERVGDMTQTIVDFTQPFISGWLLGEGNITSSLISGAVWSQVQNKARQPYDMTVNYYGSKYTWTYNTLSNLENYSIPYPIVNVEDFHGIGTLAGKINIPAGRGMLMCPSWKLLFYNDDEAKTSTPFYQWSFEIIYDPRGQFYEVYNAGTRAIDAATSGVYDICTWYVEDPAVQTPPLKYYGNFKQMIAAKKSVDLYNKTATEENQKVFTGDFVTQPVPLTMTGQIDFNAINGLTRKTTLRWLKGNPGRWHLAWR